MHAQRITSCLRTARIVVAASLLAAAAGCAVHDDAPDTLYAELGGEAGIARLVNGLLVTLAGDERIRHHFEGLHIAGFRGRLETHFCQITGGPCTFDGRSMRESHQRLAISEADFNALVEDLIDAMDQLGIEQGTQNRFLARLAPMQPDVVVDDSDPAAAPGD